MTYSSRAQAPQYAFMALGAVSLNVRDMAALQQCYADVIGLTVLRQTSQMVVMGSGHIPIVILHATPDLPPALLSAAGLYHLAIVFDSRGDLARAVTRVLQAVPDLYVGSGDHLVSESFYLSDPEGNGIELYYDRDPAEWEWEDGYVKMTTLYIPEQQYLEEHVGDSSTGTVRLGHVHLKVGDLGKAKSFYVDTVGFAVTAQLPSALFLAKHQYHHHVGMNTWQSAGAARRAHTLGLKNFEILLPHQAEVERVLQHAERSELSVFETETGMAVTDPWNNQVVLKTQ